MARTQGNFITGRKVDPLRSLNQAFGANGAMAQHLMAKDTYEQNQITNAQNAEKILLQQNADDRAETAESRLAEEYARVNSLRTGAQDISKNYQATAGDVGVWGNTDSAISLEQANAASIDYYNRAKDKNGTMDNAEMTALNSMFNQQYNDPTNTVVGNQKIAIQQLAQKYNALGMNPEESLKRATVDASGTYDREGQQVLANQQVDTANKLILDQAKLQQGFDANLVAGAKAGVPTNVTNINGISAGSGLGRSVSPTQYSAEELKASQDVLMSEFDNLGYGIYKDNKDIIKEYLNPLYQEYAGVLSPRDINDAIISFKDDGFMKDTLSNAASPAAVRKVLDKAIMNRVALAGKAGKPGIDPSIVKRLGGREVPKLQGYSSVVDTPQSRIDAFRNLGVSKIVKKKKPKVEEPYKEPKQVKTVTPKVNSPVVSAPTKSSDMIPKVGETLNYSKVTDFSKPPAKVKAPMVETTIEKVARETQDTKNMKAYDDAQLKSVQEAITKQLAILPNTQSNRDYIRKSLGKQYQPEVVASVLSKYENSKKNQKEVDANASRGKSISDRINNR